MPVGALACLAAAELIVAPAIMPFVYWHQAHEDMFASGAMLTLAPFARVCAVTTAALCGIQELTVYAVMHLIWLTAIAAMPNVLSNSCRAFHKMTSASAALRAIREGLPYTVSGAAITAGSELDKTILLRTQGEILTGQYTAAYRIMQAATLPVNSLILAAAPRMFRSATTAARPLLRPMLAGITGYAAMVGLVLAVLSPLTHLLLGREFIPSEPLLRLFCLVLFTNCIRQLITAQLTAGDKQAIRNMAEIAGLAVSVTLLFALTPSLGAKGAIIALGASDLAVISLGVKGIINTPAKSTP
jgi:O-antigen/teichoic acid export membrane protein